MLLFRVWVGGRASGWVVRDTQGACMYICLCVSIYVNMYMLTRYVYGIATPASKISLITIVSDYKSFQNSFPYEILATIPNTSYYRLMKGESRTHAQHPVRVA